MRACLPNFAVLPQRDRQVRDFHPGVNKRAHRRVGVERFRASELFFGCLEIAVADIFADRITEDMLECAVRRQVLRARADDHSQFQLEMRLMLRKRDLDRASMRQE